MSFKSRFKHVWHRYFNSTPSSETKEQKNGAMHSAIDSSWNFLFASATPPRQSSPRVPPLLDPAVLRLVSQASFTYKHVPPYSSINIANYTLLVVTHSPWTEPENLLKNFYSRSGISSIHATIFDGKPIIKTGPNGNFTKPLPWNTNYMLTNDKIKW